MFCCFSEEGGLQLIFGEVKEDSPAWKSGIRPSDVIVTVNDWLITIMDKPQVRDQAIQLFYRNVNAVVTLITIDANRSQSDLKELILKYLTLVAEGQI